jgi:hypothetical protein
MSIDQKWFSIIGLFIDLIGAILIGMSVVVKKKEAIELGLSRICSDVEEENLTLPQVQDRLRQSRNTVIGFMVLAAGFIFQIIGSWPS